jgi:hypothetical protein
VKKEIDFNIDPDEQMVLTAHLMSTLDILPQGYIILRKEMCNVQFNLQEAWYELIFPLFSSKTDFKTSSYLG